MALDLSSAFISFAEEAYSFPGNSKWDKVKVVDALRHKIKSLFQVVCSDSPREDKVECEMLIKKLLSMVDQMKKDLKMRGWLHMPPTSDKYQYCKLLCGVYEAFGYQSLGMIATYEETEASYKRSITHHQKAKAIYDLLGLADRAKSIEFTISLHKDRLARCDVDGVSVSENVSILLKEARYQYKYLLKTYGLTSGAALQSGFSSCDRACSGTPRYRS